MLFSYKGVECEEIVIKVLNVKRLYLILRTQYLSYTLI